MTESRTPTAHTGPARLVLVTGATRGIGLAVATHFVDAGYRVVGTHRDRLPDQPDPRIHWVRCDVTDTASVDEAFSSVEQDLGVVEVLVANAGTTADGLLLRMSDEDIMSVIDTNLVGSMRVARRAVAKMIRARWGRVVFVGSVVGTTGQAGQANYAAAKAGLIGLARSLAREFASRNITVNVVAPGPVATDMLAAAGDERIAAIARVVPLGRLAEPGEIAAAIGFLASGQAGFITGAVLPVDGGLAMGPW